MFMRLCGFAAMILVLLVGRTQGDEPVVKEPTTPTRLVRLFDGRDLKGLSPWLEHTRHEDPRRVFQVTDGLLHITGEDAGYLATDAEYRDYRLVVEYKWGKKTDGGKYVRNSGILLNAIGPDGSAGGGKWMASIECQLAQGCVGDLICIRGNNAKGETIPVRLTSETVNGPDGRPRWKKGANRASSPVNNSGGRTTIRIFRSCSTPGARTMSRAP